MNYTSYFSNIRNIRDNCVAISISRGTPPWFQGPRCKELAPPWELVNSFKQHIIEFEDFAEVYTNILSELSPSYINDRLLSLSGGAPYALICYEKDYTQCHRSLVASWLREAGIYIVEYGNLLRSV